LFQAFLKDVANKAGVKAKLAPLKDKERATQKGDADYVDRECPEGAPAVGWVFDIVRGTLVCDSAKQIETVVKLLVTDKQVKVVIKFKNRFKNPTPNGFCDMLLQIVFSDSSGINHVCEVQVHLRQIAEYAADHKSHESYDFFRVYFDGSMNTVASRLEDMAVIVGQDFVPAEDGTPAADVMEDIVSDVVESKDSDRLYKMAALCGTYVVELDLAVYIYKILVEVILAEHGFESEAAGRSFNNLANVLCAQDKLGEAMEMYEKSLASRLALGPDNSDVAKAYTGIANVLQAQGKLGEAMGMHEKALAVRLKTLRPDHSDVATTNYNIGVVLGKQGKLEEAMEMHQRALAIRLKTLGPYHSDFAATYNSIANILQGQGKLDEAMEMHEKSLAIKLKTLGPEHSDVAASYSNMANVIQGQENLGAAMEMYGKSLAIDLKNLGSEHSQVATTYYNIAFVLSKQGNNGDAMEMYEKSLAIQLKTLGPKHSSVGDTFYNMANLAENQGNLKQAAAFFIRVAYAYEEAYGKEHSQSIDALAQAKRVLAIIK
jgi:tetratricopeptide (TPR) repeat protein